MTFIVEAPDEIHLLEESDMGPEPSADATFVDKTVWAAKCGIIRFRYREDPVETLAYYDMLSSLLLHTDLAEAVRFINAAVQTDEREDDIKWCHRMMKIDRRRRRSH